MFKRCCQPILLGNVLLVVRVERKIDFTRFVFSMSILLCHVHSVSLCISFNFIDKTKYNSMKTFIHIDFLLIKFDHENRKI